MKFTKIGDTNVNFSVITFGAWAIGDSEYGGVEPQEAIRAFHRAYELGATSIDTAPCYGNGYSEEVVGEAIKRYPKR